MVDKICRWAFGLLFMYWAICSIIWGFDVGGLLGVILGLIWAGYLFCLAMSTISDSNPGSYDPYEADGSDEFDDG